MSSLCAVGNIPYEATEEQLKEIFNQAGPVVSFRLVYDRETGKPKGYGFCEYQDVETAQSAMRNLNNHDFNGRPLRVGVAAGEQTKDENKSMQQALGGPPVEVSFNPTVKDKLNLCSVVRSPYGDPVEPEKAPEAISRAVASLPPEQMFELMKQMKICIQNNPNEARNMLLQNPQLAYALLQAQIVMKIVDPQVALAMLHRQTEQIPPLVPSTGGAPGGDAPPTATGDVDNRVMGMPGGPPRPQGQGPRGEPGSSEPQRPPGNINRGPPAGMGGPGVGGPQPGMGGGPPGGRMGGPQGGMGGPHGAMGGTKGSMDNFQGGPQGGMRPGMGGPGGMAGPGGMGMGRGEPPSSGAPPTSAAMGRQDYGGGRGPDRGMEGPGRGPGGPGLGGPGFMERGGPGPMGPDYGGRGPGGGPMGHGAEPRGPGPRPDGRDPRQAGDPRRPPSSMPSTMPRSQAPTSVSGGPSQGGAGVSQQDQEKAALIMQVLQLSDEQIALLPHDQRQSILILKEQIARSGGGM